MSSAQSTQDHHTTEDISIPNGMTREEAIEACEYTAQADNAMSEVANELLKRL